MNKRTLISALGCLCAMILTVPSSRASTIKDVQVRGHLQCGVVTDDAGFGFLDNQGRFQGFDVDTCRAIGAALGVDTQFTKLDGKTRFPALQSGEVDVVLMLVTDTMSRETALGFDFPVINFYDGQGYMVHKELNVHGIQELNGASICVTSAGTGATNTADYFRSHKMTYKPVEFQRIEDATRAYDEGRCDAIIGETGPLAALRATLKTPDAHVILPEMVSREPMGPVTRSSDRQFSDAVRWIVNGLLLAEQKGVTQANVDEIASSTSDPEVRRLLGLEGTLGDDAGLPKDWAIKMIKAVGNYGEIFDRNLGPNTPFKMKRGINALWTNGGLHYPLSFQ